jgi:UDP-N-acetylmuramoylalanine--D-glutamate ligase
MTSTTYSNANKVDLTWLEQYRRITVIGLGVSGVGVVKALTKRGIIVDVQDSREQPAGLAEVQSMQGVNSIHLGGFDQDKLLENDLLIVSPGVSLNTPELQFAINKGVKVSGDIDIVARSVDVPIVAISGSNGKSTVTQLAGEICKLAGYKTFIGGNIGLSAMKLLDEKECDVAVLELSSFQLETTPELAAHSAILLNLSPDHLDRYEGFQEYAQAKLAIYSQAKHVVWNRDDEFLQKVDIFHKKEEKKIISFGLNMPNKDTDYGLIEEIGKRLLVKGKN